MYAVYKSFTYNVPTIWEKYQPKVIKPKICGLYVIHIWSLGNTEAVPT